MKILFVGNSHTYFNDMPHWFAGMMEHGTGIQTEADMLAYSGRNLHWHRTEYFSLRYQLLYGHYNWCIIQQVAHPFPPREETTEDATWIVDLCRQLHVKTGIVTSWSEKRNPGIQDEMNMFYRNLSKKTDSILIPIGEAWQDVRMKHPEIELYWQDGAHASPTGDYLTAMVLYGAISQKRNFEDLPDKAIDYLSDTNLDFEHPSCLLQPENMEVKLSRDTKEILIHAAETALRS